MPDDASETPNKSLRAHHACEQGDLAALLDALDHPADFPNCRDLPALGEGFLLAYLIYWSPLPFIDTVIRLGADPNYPADDGFPAVIAALSSERPEKYALVQLLLDRGAHVNARGINDWTPLHWAVAHRDVRAIELLLAAHADPRLATTIDDYTTPLEDAEQAGFEEAVRLLRAAAGSGPPRR